MRCFSRKSWSIVTVIDTGGPVFPLVCMFIRHDNLRVWHKLFMNLYKLKSPFDFLRNTSTLSRFIGQVDSTDCHEISPEHSRDNDKPKCVGKFWYLTQFSRGVHLSNTSRIFLATLTLNGNISITNQNSKKACHPFVDWCLANKTVQPFCSYCGIWYPINSIEEPSVIPCLTTSWHKIKLYFFVKCIIKLSTDIQFVGI